MEVTALAAGTALPPTGLPRKLQKEWIRLERTRINAELVSSVLRSAVTLAATVPALPLIVAWVTVTQLEDRGVISNADQVLLKTAIGASAAGGILSDAADFIGKVLPA